MAKTPKGKSKSVKANRKSKKTASTKNIEKIVDDKLAVEAEKKTAFYTTGNWQAIRSINDPSNYPADNIKILTPSQSLTQSTITIGQSLGGTSDERIGNKIKTFSAHVNIMIRPNLLYDITANYNPQPLFVRMYIVKLRPHLEDTVGNLTTIIANTFFENGSTSTGFNGTIIDFTKMINNIQIDVCKTKTFKLGNAGYISNFGVNLPNNGSQQFQNNDFKLCQQYKIDITKYHNKYYYFNDGTNNSNQRRMYMFFVPFRIDGTTYQTGATPPSQIGCIPAYYTCNYLYKFTDF